MTIVKNAFETVARKVDLDRIVYDQLDVDLFVAGIREVFATGDTKEQAKDNLLARIGDLVEADDPRVTIQIPNIEDVTFSFEYLWEDLDPSEMFDDKEYEDLILDIYKRVREGDPYAWFSASCFAIYGEYEGHFALGCNTYGSRQEFLDDMGQTMEEEAYRDLIDQMIYS